MKRPLRDGTTGFLYGELRCLFDLSRITHVVATFGGDNVGIVGSGLLFFMPLTPVGRMLSPGRRRPVGDRPKERRTRGDRGWRGGD